MIVRELLTIFGIEYDEAAAKKTSSSIDALASKAKQMAALFAGGLVAQGLANFVQHNVEAANSLAKLSERLGMSTESIQELRYAASQVGVDQNDLDEGLQQFLIRVTEAEQGSADLKKSFKDMGIALRDSFGQLRSPEALFSDLADGIARLPTEVERLGMASQFFEDTGLPLISMLKGGSAGLASMRAEARQFGAVINSDGVQSLGQLNGNLIRAGFLLKNLANQILGAFMPTLNGLAQLAAIAGKGIAELANHTTIFHSSLIILGTVLTALAIKTVIAFAPVILTVGAIAAGIAAVVLIVDDLFALFNGGESVIGHFSSVLKEGFATTWQNVMEGFTRFRDWILSGITGIAQTTASILAKLTPDFFRKGLHANATLLVAHGQESRSGISRSLVHRTMNQSVYSPSSQNVKVNVQVQSGSNPREIGGEVAKAVRSELEKERRTAFYGLVQSAQ